MWKHSCEYPLCQGLLLIDIRGMIILSAKSIEISSLTVALNMEHDAIRNTQNVIRNMPIDKAGRWHALSPDYMKRHAFSVWRFFIVFSLGAKQTFCNIFIALTSSGGWGM